MPPLIAPLIREMYENGELKTLLKQFNSFQLPRSLREDFEHDLIVMLLEHQDQERLVRIYAQDVKKWRMYVFKVCLNNLNSTKSPFYFKYRRWMKKHVLCDGEITENKGCQH